MTPKPRKTLMDYIKDDLRKDEMKNAMKKTPKPLRKRKRHVHRYDRCFCQTILNKGEGCPWDDEKYCYCGQQRGAVRRDGK